jgi:hypothetical protein
MELDDELDGLPDPKHVASRADARPSEEATSDNPEAQAQLILEESEERIADGARSSESTEEPLTE